MEVKAGNTATKSLNRFIEAYKPSAAYKIVDGNDRRERRKTHYSALYGDVFIKDGYIAVNRDWLKIQRKYGKTAQEKRKKNIAHSWAIIYIPKTGDFRLQTVMLPIGRF